MRRLFEFLKTVKSRSFRYPLHLVLQILPKGNRRRIPEQPKSICILSQEKLGDAVLLMPLLQGLKDNFTQTKIIILASSRNKPFFEKLPWVDQIYCYRPMTFDFFVRFRKEQFDVFFNPKDHPSRTFLLLTLFAKAYLKVGFAHPLLAHFYHRTLIFNDEYIARKNAALLNLWQIPYPEKTGEFLSMAVSDKWSQALPDAHSHIRIGINLSAGQTIREWGTDKVSQLLHKFEKEPVEFILLGTAQKQSIIEILSRRFPSVTRLPQTKDVWDLAFVVGKLDYLITPDTSTLHLAKMQGIPVIGLFQNRPGNLNRFFQPDKKNRAICSQGLNVHDIPVDQVIDTLMKLMETSN